MSTPLKPIVERPPLTEGQIHPHPVINRILQNRGIKSMDEMEYSLNQLIEPFIMAGMTDAVRMLEKHIRKGGRIVVVGDFDCDGATSTSVAVDGLRLLGAKDIHFLIPDRQIHGYGLTPSIVKLAAELEPDLILTVDNGIASYDGAKAVKELKHPCELLVTDHHLPGDKGLPCADVIVNPNQHGCPFPSKNLAGCGVMFYVIMALRAHLREVGYFDEVGLKQPNIGSLLDLVAVGTIADVVPLDKNNRILVEAGLNRIRNGQGRPGIRAILEVARKNPAKVVASDMGFALGPRINAAGRLDDMSIGIQCLLSTDDESARQIAQRLDDLNQQRRDIEADHVIDANLYIEEHDLRSIKGVVIHDPAWHAGVVGIVSSRIKDVMNRPVICMTDTTSAQEKRQELLKLEQEDAPDSCIQACRDELGECEVKGSARSIEGIHLKHLLDHIAKAHPDILTKFGGHSMAAGLSLKSKNLERFKKLFNEEVAKEITEEQMLGNVVVDIKDMDASFLTMDLARAIRDLGPWGQHFPEPTFHARFSVISKQPMKGKHLRFKLAIDGNPDQVFEAVAFGAIKNGEAVVDKSFEGSFRIDINEYPVGTERLQLMLGEIQDPEYLLKKSRQAKEPVVTSAEPVQQCQLAHAVHESSPAVDGSAAPQAAGDSRIAGLAARQTDNPIARVRDNMKTALEAIKESTRPIKHPASEDPAPF